MTKVIVEKDGLTLEARQVSPKGLAEIIKIIFAESKDENDTKADEIREQFRRGKLDKIQAIKSIRELFADSTDWRYHLKGAKDFIEGANSPEEEL